MLRSILTVLPAFQIKLSVNLLCAGHYVATELFSSMEECAQKEKNEGSLFVLRYGTDTELKSPHRDGARPIKMFTIFRT